MLDGTAALLLLAVVLAFALASPHGLPEALVAVPAAGLALLLGLTTPAAALGQLGELGPTIAFLAAILLLGYLADVEACSWRRVLVGAGVPPTVGEFAALGLLTVPAALVGAVVALWAGLQLT